MSVCSVVNCNSKTVAKGYCDRHYRQVIRNGNVLKYTKTDGNEIVCDNCTCRIKLYSKLQTTETIIDKHDHNRVKNYRWYRNGTDGYVLTNYKDLVGNYHKLFLHHLICPCDSGYVVDHINGDILDNRRHNLRVCTHTQNIQNQRLRTNNTSGAKGVVWHKRDHIWEVSITSNGTRHYLGRYKSKIDAINAYNKASMEFHGAFSNTNTVK
jgi:hypothetical protein